MSGLYLKSILKVHKESVADPVRGALIFYNIFKGLSLVY